MSEPAPAKTVLLWTILVVGVLTLLREGVPLLLIGLMAAFLLTAKLKGRQ